jgi:hypothetical protein
MQPAAALLLLLLGRWAGLSWADLGLALPGARDGVMVGLVGAVLVAARYALALALAAARGLPRTRYDVDLRSALRMALAAIPLSTVVFEEVALRRCPGASCGQGWAHRHHRRVVAALLDLARAAGAGPPADEQRRRRSPAKDKATGELVWTVTCIDRDESVPPRDRQVTVKASAPVQPVLPGRAPGLPVSPD